MGLYAIPTADLLDTLIKTLGVGYDYMTLFYYFIGSGLGACGALTFSPIINLTGGLSKPLLYPVQGPFGVFTVGKSLPEVLHFFLQQLGFCYTVFAL